MATKKFCDYCEEEIGSYQVGERITSFEINDSPEKDICIDCSKKVIELLDSIPKK